ncbi:hypothetical protein ABB37_09160 [Leptomonas pyrrhocoris]|uniref:Transmembrane protein n=1 Tax=Leptomonas pyrrhocoris TaxID=157538 RepID=A0A0M9FRP5_LEPPY|nr:hypothetical protein ABB37_09160 [Leptomonas pyrrhocoris]XP_015652936.1 hypothetical protein ABB37_09160 [Leptomonas pyrrhocoris]KPA74496.1 hypothetical protein ABB37_09160 [Leptomonas pyrrhocoris]KPA74497.1 hypothetical protein ABB37_09160 [Leptomonas pyrrhocoris]|eukprot:XP_015652935.1 hypothetical protein ABB37_09160 [Leptomonas pyrrhocoris]
MEGAFSSSDDTANGLQWEWWMLVLIGFIGSAVVVGLIVGVLCLVWRCCPRRSSRECIQNPLQVKAHTTSPVHRERRTSVPSQILSFESEAEVGAAPSCGGSYAESTLDFNPVSVWKDWAEEGEAANVVNRSPSLSPLPPSDRAAAEAAAGTPAASTEGTSSLFSMNVLERSAPPEDFFAAVRSGESPKKRVRRHRSVSSLMEMGLSHDESLRLHLMRHSNTSDPAFGTFVKSSHSKH